jgi:nickel-dependent lactate racemase
MLIAFPYGHKTIEMEFPDDTVVLSGKELPAISDDDIRAKLEKPLAEFRRSAADKKISIIINDITRRIPTEKILGIILRYVPVGNVEILVATGTHKIPAGDDLRRILGDLFERLKTRIYPHDCDDNKLLANIGRTSRGTPVEVNTRFLEAGAAICVNSVEPHFFAGFTGGRKSIIPGLAGRNTVIVNHSLAKSERAKSLNLADNPVHLDLVEAMELAAQKPLFSIQMVLSRKGEIIDLFCGDMVESFSQASKLAREVHAVPVTMKYDIVMAIGEHPLDINLYQLQKAQEHGAEAVAEGGILIVVGACEEGIGSPFFVKLADEYPSPESALSDAALYDNRFGIHKLIKTARRLDKIKIWYVTKLDDKVIRKVYFEPKCSPESALRDALEYFGGRANIAVLKDACFVVPVRIDVEGGL